MHFLALSLALQQSFAPTAADSARAHGYLAKVLAEYPNATRSPGVVPPEYRILNQLRFWGLRDRGAEAASMFDARNGPRIATYSFEHRTSWVHEYLERGDSVEAWRLVDSLPPERRDSLLTNLALRYGGRGPMAVLLESRVATPSFRGKLMHRRAQALLQETRDTVAARALIAQAIPLLRQDTARMSQYESRTWMVDLHVMGGDLSVDDLIRVAAEDFGNLWLGRYEVAVALSRPRPAAARQLVQALLAEPPPREPPFVPNLIANLHELLGTAQDSARARSLRDSVLKVRGQTESSSYSRADWELDRAARRRDTVQLKAALTRGDVSVQAVHNAFGAVRGDLTRPVYDTATRASARRVAQVLLAHPGVFSSAMSTEQRDSISVARIAVLVHFSTTDAIRDALAIETPRFRDRAIATCAVFLARVDVDSAAVLAAPLQDELARNSAYETLSLRAVAGARHGFAERLLDHVTGDLARVRVRVALAAANWDLRPDEALRHVRAALVLLDPRERCEHCAIVSAPGAVPRWEGMPALLRREVMQMSRRVQPTAEMVAWASSQSTAERRMEAYLLLAETLADEERPWRPTNLPP